MKRAEDNEQFFDSTRLTLSQFEELLQLLKLRLESPFSTRALSAEHRLLVTLKYVDYSFQYNL